MVHSDINRADNVQKNPERVRRLIRSYARNQGGQIPNRWLYIGAFLPLTAFVIDVTGTKLAIWKGGVISQHVFLALVAVAAIMVLKFIPSNINAAAKAKELEMEKIVLNAKLAESRISTMMSQIRPHFIYNTLGSIEQLCKMDPPKASDLAHNFAKYLRGNFGELDNPKPILMSQEMEHVRYYVSIRWTKPKPYRIRRGFHRKANYDCAYQRSEKVRV